MLERAERTIERLLQTVETLAAAVGQGAATAPASRAGGQARGQAPCSLKDFLQLRNPEFWGDRNSAAIAEDWLDLVTRNLEALGVTDDQTRLTFATYLLRGDAYQWWRRVQDSIGGNFEEFSRSFLENYFPLPLRDARRREFYELVQGGMSVADYEARFTSLSRYAPEMATSEDLRCSRFEGGLRTEIFTLLMSSRIRVYSQLVSAAMNCEEGFKLRRTQESRSRQGNFGQSGGDRDAKRQRPAEYAPPQPQRAGRSTATSAPAGSTQSGAKTGTCFKCHQPGHVKAQCPRRRVATPPQPVQGSRYRA